MDLAAKHQEFENLKQRVEQLEEELNAVAADQPWQPNSFYWAYHATSGFLLGIIGASAALLMNVVLAPMAGKHPLELIRVYLTFPLGEEALQLTEAARDVPAVRDGMVLAFGCCLYLGTGMLLGIPFHLAMTRLVPQGSVKSRLLVATILALAIWLIGFYGILIWLQPALFGGDWITSGKYLPWWVAAATHLVFGWTMALLLPLTRFIPNPPAPNVPERSDLDRPIEPGG